MQKDPFLKDRHVHGLSGMPVLLLRGMFISIFLTVVCVVNLYATGHSQEKLTLSMKDVKLSQIFSVIEHETDYQFLYNDEDVRNSPLVSVAVKDATVPQIMAICFKDYPLRYRIENKTVVVLPGLTAEQGGLNFPVKAEVIQFVVRGKVTDPSGSPLDGVSVSLKGTQTGVITSAGGDYALTLPDDKGTLVFSYVGYIKKEVPLNGRAVINVSMVPADSSMDQIVVIGYGTQKRSEITGAITTVSGSDIASSNTGSVQEALQGRVAGVNITPTTGQPGSPLDMNIRGVATFGNGSPLFVIDGIPIIDEGGSRNFNPLASLNPNDIESIQILKDASAAAIYGSRAANGVVIVTTKRGVAGENRIQFYSSVGVSDVTKYVDMMNSQQYTAYAIDALQNGGKPIAVSLKEPLLSENLKRNTNWQKELFSPGLMQNHWLSVSGGNDHANYSFSGGYTNEEGTLPKSGFKRYSIKVNSDYKIGKRLKIGESIALSRSTWTGTFDPTSPMMNQLLMSSPTVPVYKADADGGFDGNRTEYSIVGRANTIGLLNLVETRNVQNNITANVYANLEILPGLTNQFSLGGDISLGRSFNFTPTYDMGNNVNTLADLIEGRNDNNIFLIQNTTTYQKTFNNVHKFTALIGFTQQQSLTTSTGVEVRDFQSNDLRTIAAGFEQRSITGNETEWALQSQMGRLSYSYRSKYNLMAVIRRDGSSRFGSNNRYGVFPSISGSWRISEEPFLAKSDAISNLTLRASYGKVGSQNISDYAQYAIVQPNINYILGSGQQLVSGATFTNIGNPNLKWEVTTQTNIGLDVAFFGRKLSFGLDYYIKNTDGVLVQLPIPTTSGINRSNGPFVNAGSLQNHGIEFSANYDNSVGDFKYSLSGNIAFNKNKVIALGTNQPIIAQWTRGKQYATTITTAGGEIGSFYGYTKEGIFKDQADVDTHATQTGSSPGDVKFKDLNGDGVIDANDQSIIGSPYPDFTYGFNASLAYKNFDMIVFIAGKQGQDIYNLLWPSINDGQGDNNATTEMLRRWTSTNTNTDIPRAVALDPGQNTRPSTRFVEDGSYLRIQNIQIGYTIGSHILNRVKGKARAYVSVKNLATFTKYKGYNPEVGTLFEGSRSSLIRGIDNAAYPIPRVIEGGIQLDF